MFTKLDQKAYKELVSSFSWQAELVDFNSIPVPNQKRSRDEAIENIIVQLCLTEILSEISGVSFCYVPNRDKEITYDHLLCFFRYVYQIGERDDFVLFYICSPKEHSLQYYLDAVDKNGIHYLFTKSWENRHLLSKFHQSNTESMKMRYEPKDTFVLQNGLEYNLLNYIKKFSWPTLLNIPLILKEDEFEHYDFFRIFKKLKFQIFLSVYKKNGMVLLSQSMGIYNRSTFPVLPVS